MMLNIAAKDERRSSRRMIYYRSSSSSNSSTINKRHPQYYFLLLLLLHFLSYNTPFVCAAQHLKNNANNGAKNKNNANNRAKNKNIPQPPLEEDVKNTPQPPLEEDDDKGEEAGLASSAMVSSTNLLSNAYKDLNATDISNSACEKIEIAISYITSLDFDSTFLNVTNAPKSEKITELVDIYLLQIIITPISIAMVLFGSQLLIPMSVISAASVAVILVFHFATNKAIFPWDLNCIQKLLLSFVTAFVAGLIASLFLKFGLFCLGGLAAGAGSYLLFDAFPILDFVVHNVTHAAGLSDYAPTESDLSTIGWMITIFAAICGGSISRIYEQSTLEVVTSTIGAIGCSYSLHTFVIMSGGQLDRHLVFIMTGILSIFGSGFQRNRRKWREATYSKRNDDYNMNGNPYNEGMLPQNYQQHHQMYPGNNFQSMPMFVPPPHQGFPAGPQQPPSQAWSQQIQSLLGGGEKSSNGSQPATSKQITELTTSLNSFMEKMEKDNGKSCGKKSSPASAFSLPSWIGGEKGKTISDMKTDNNKAKGKILAPTKKEKQ